MSRPLTAADRIPEPGDVLTEPDTGKFWFVFSVGAFRDSGNDGVTSMSRSCRVRHVSTAALRGESWVISADGRYCLGMESKYPDGLPPGTKYGKRFVSWPYAARADGCPLTLDDTSDTAQDRESPFREGDGWGR